MSDPATRGWSSPRRPGPARPLVVRCLVVGALLVTAGWLFGARILDRRDLDGRTERITQPAPATPAAKRLYARGADRWVAQQYVLRASNAERVLVTVATPSELDPSGVSIRARSADARVRLRRNAVGEPVADLHRLGAQGVVHVLVVRPATPQETASPAARRAPSLAHLTEAFDRRAGRAQAAARTLDRAQGAGAWLVPLLVLLAVGGPLAALFALRRRWFGLPVPGVPGVEPTGPPGTGAAVTAALATRGTRAADVGAAFAGQVLELVETGVIDARRASDPTVGPALMLRIARRPEAAPDLVQAALDVLDVHTPAGSTSLLVPDQPRPPADPAARPRAAARWRSALAQAQASSGQVEAPRWKWWLRAGQLLSLAMFVLVTLAVRASAAGDAARWWILLAAVAAAAYTVRQAEQELRRWRRVPATARSGRAQWLAWHDVLARQAPADVDPRSLAFAAATGLGAALVPAVAPIGAIGVAGVTTTSLEQLAALV